jgi:hypothetical protein
MGNASQENGTRAVSMTTSRVMPRAWRKVITATNGREVKLVKVRGEFLWRRHEQKDEYVVDVGFTEKDRDPGEPAEANGRGHSTGETAGPTVFETAPGGDALQSTPRRRLRS